MAGILAIDIGGTGLKAAMVDDAGKLIGERLRVATPHPCPPKVLVDTIVGMVQPLSGYDRISIAFPGFVRDGKVLTAPNLGTPDWAGFELQKTLAKRLGGHPARMLNDADMQGLAIVSGKGLEMVLTLGTGAGTALFRDGELMPHMELAHHPLHGDKTYDEYIGNAALAEKGKRKWSERVHSTIAVLSSLLNYDRLYLSGGNAKHVAGELPKGVSLASNEAGLEGGAVLWREKAPKS